MKSRWLSLIPLLTMLAIPLAMPVAAGAQDFPTGPVRMVVPYPPGGAVDILGRLLAQKLAKELGQPLVVENKAGASGIIGTEAAAKAAPDGYTLLMAYFSTLATHPSLYAKLPYDPLKDFAPVSLVAKTSLIMVVPPSVPAATLQEFIALAKSKPGQLSYASIGNGSGAHLAAELLKRTAGVDIVQVPYKGSGPALTDLLGGHVHMMFDAMPSALPLAQSGKLRALAVTSARRMPTAPNLPTVAEAGFPTYELTPWLGVMAPAGTPREVVQKLNAAIGRIVVMADFREELARLGAEPAATTPEQFGAFIQAEMAKWGKLIRDANIKAD